VDAPREGTTLEIRQSTKLEFVGLARTVASPALFLRVSEARASFDALKKGSESGSRSIASVVSSCSNCSSWSYGVGGGSTSLATPPPPLPFAPKTSRVRQP